MDAFGHINNVIYFRYFESARINFFTQTNLWKDFNNDDVRIVVVKLECNYAHEIVYPEEIEIGVAIKQIGNSSMHVHHVVKSTAKNIIFAHGEGVIVSTDPKTGKSKPWTEDLKNKLNQWI
jgi:acyl-CoA thioester hydrolase